MINEEIKYRGYVDDVLRWVHGIPLINECGTYITNGNPLCAQDGSLKILEYDHVIPGTITQYIELKDKNDKEIYVGHKVKCNQYHNNYLVEKDIVITVNNLWSRLRTDSTLRDFEIIGDVFNYEILNHPWLREYMDHKKIISCFDVNSDDFKTWSETKREEFESYVKSILFEEEKSCLN